MGIRFQRAKTPNGHEYLDVIFFGESVSGGDVELWKKEVYPGMKNYGLAQLCHGEGGRDVKMSTEFREKMSELAPKRLGFAMPIALVTQSTVMRVAVDFIMTVLRIQTSKMHATHADAIAWLDEQIPKMKAKQGPYAKNP